LKIDAAVVKMHHKTGGVRNSPPGKSLTTKGCIISLTKYSLLKSRWDIMKFVTWKLTTLQTMVNMNLDTWKFDRTFDETFAGTRPISLRTRIVTWTNFHYQWPNHGNISFSGPLGWEASPCKSRLVVDGGPLSTGAGSIEDESFSCEVNLASGEVSWSVKHQWPQRVSMLNEMTLGQGGR
jgi:hypothetical protein